ncbi:Gfo/Idh/MocA family oxidoreductase [soil metagenome]|jgi:predicted dehydrogenase|nr:Gfo/Idh/MocA family oxidoreductase [Actinomycetota bacterium]
MAEIGVGLVGYKFMGRAHSNAYRQLPRFFDVDPVPRMAAICGRDEAGVREAADSLGWESYETDYRRLIERDDVGLVDVVTPGNTHREIVLAALIAGKHVICEKPLANTLAEAKEMLTAARDAGTVNTVCFNYRRAPAVQLARKLIDEGRLGTIRHWRSTYLQDFIMDPGFPLIWRLKKELAGSGALGDLGAHSVDLAHFLVGGISEVAGMTETFVKERPLEGSGGETGEVTVDDAAAFLARFENGAMGTFEATRFAAGRRNRNAFEINGSKGSVAFDLERMNELEVFFVDDDTDVQGFRTVNATEPEHPYAGAWWPPGHIIGYEHTFVHTIKDLMDGIKMGESPAPTFEDAYRCQAVLDAVERSVEGGGWTRPETGGI